MRKLEPSVDTRADVQRAILAYAEEFLYPDKADGLKPFMIVALAGTTGLGAMAGAS